MQQPGRHNCSDAPSVPTARTYSAFLMTSLPAIRPKGNDVCANTLRKQDRLTTIIFSTPPATHNNSYPMHNLSTWLPRESNGEFCVTVGPSRGSSSPFQHFEPARVKPN